MKELVVAILCLGAAAGGVSLGSVPSSGVPAEAGDGTSTSTALVFNEPIAITSIAPDKVNGYLILRYSIEIAGVSPGIAVLERVLPALSNRFFYEHNAREGMILTAREYLDLADRHEGMIKSNFPAANLDVRLLQLEYFTTKAGREGAEFDPR